MAGEGGTRCGHLPLAHNALRAGVPVPQEHGAVGRAGRNVAVGGDVALGPREARDDAKVAKDDLHDLGRLRGEDAETVVPEAAGDQETAVHGGHEAVAADL